MKVRNVLLSWLPYLFMLLAAYLLHKQLGKIDFATLMDEIRRWRVYHLEWALGLTALSYAMLVLYDFLSLHHLKKKIPAPQVIVTAFSAFSISNIVGHSLLSGSSVRLRSYGRAGLSLSEVATLALFNTLTFGIGFCFLLALALVGVAKDPALQELWLPPSLLASLLFGLVCVYLAFAFRWGGKSISIKGLRLELPSLATALQQVGLGALDLSLCAAILYVLLPGSLALSFWSFLSYYLIAQMLGVLSQVPGGLGVLDGLLLRFLSSYAPAHQLLISIILFRLIYYTLPLTLTCVGKATAFLIHAFGPASKTSDSKRVASENASV